MKIDNKEFLNPQQQLYQNTKDIEKLKADYQPVYSYNGLIGSTTIHTVNRSSTNVPAGVNIGWLMDYTGKLFKITDGSATALLIDYYAQIKGPKGDTGATGPQGEKGDTGPQGPQGEPGETTIGVEVLSQLPDATSENYETYKGEIVFVPNSSSDDENQYEEYMIQKDELKDAYSYTLPSTYEMETLGVIFGEEPSSEYETIYSDTYNDSISVKLDTTNFKAVIKNTSGGTYNKYYIFDQQNSINGWYDDEAATTPVSGSVSAAHYNPGSPYFVYQDFDRVYAVLTGKASAYSWELLGGATVDLTNYALKSELPVIDEDLIPKAFDTYVLGDNTHSYKEVVANKFKTPNDYFNITAANVSGHGVASLRTTDGNGNNEGLLQIRNTSVSINKSLVPTTSGLDLGSTIQQFNNLNLAGKILTDDNLTYGLTLPDTTSFTADKTLATTDQIPNGTIYRHLIVLDSYIMGEFLAMDSTPFFNNTSVTGAELVQYFPNITESINLNDGNPYPLSLFQYNNKQYGNIISQSEIPTVSTFWGTTTLIFPKFPPTLSTTTATVSGTTVLKTATLVTKTNVQYTSSSNYTLRDYVLKYCDIV